MLELIDLVKKYEMGEHTVYALKGVSLTIDDSEFVARTLSNFLWVTFTRSNPAADVHGVESFVFQKHWGCRGPLVIDARAKPHHAPPLVEDAMHVILFAGGIGITPIWCMVQRLARLGRAWTLYYACRSRADMAFLQTLEKMAGAEFHFDDEHAGKVLDVDEIQGNTAHI